jgi:hypothetical protein
MNGLDAIVFGVIVLFLYFLPALIARGRRLPNTGSINLFLAWTLIGWWERSHGRLRERHKPHLLLRIPRHENANSNLVNARLFQEQMANLQHRAIGNPSRRNAYRALIALAHRQAIGATKGGTNRGHDR